MAIGPNDEQGARAHELGRNAAVGVLNLQAQMGFQQHHIGILEELSLELCEGRIASIHAMLHDVVQYVGVEILDTVTDGDKSGELVAVQIGVRTEPDENGHELSEAEHEGVRLAVKLLQAQVNGHHDDVHTHLEDGVMRPLRGDLGLPTPTDDVLVEVARQLLGGVAGCLALRCNAAQGRTSVDMTALRREDLDGEL